MGKLSVCNAVIYSTGFETNPLLTKSDLTLPFLNL